ncbi:MAG: ribonuclease III [Acidobacteria bacterium]|nr:ribonuclease III [Acidobacteriota bacterium]
MSKDLAKLEQRLGYQFQNLALLERAVTHRSWAHEHLPDGNEENVRELQNESFEFVGDSVLGLAIAEQLFLKNPTVSEGDLTLMKHHLVSTETLARLAVGLDLGEFMRVGRGEEKTGGRRKQALLADTFEAIIAAIFFDSGYVAARHFVSRVFVDELRQATPRGSIDYKTLLQETLQANKLAAPTYKVIKTEGPPHQRTFFVEAKWDGGAVSGQGNSIKQAEMMAAHEALVELETEPPDEARQIG